MIFQWANETGSHGMVKVADMEGLGWIKFYRHPFWPSSWMMTSTDGEPVSNAFDGEGR
jgi:hypothetical protein